jgi:drug/metabolite transporter (DMT)-like permease
LKNLILSTTFLAIAACLLWSSAFVGIKIGLPYTTPLHFAGIRFFLSGLIIIPFTGRFNKYLHEFRKNYLKILLLAFLTSFLQYSLFYLGLDMVPAALAAIIIGSGPLFVALIAHFFMPGDRLTVSRSLIFLLGFSGIILVSVGRNNFSTAGGASLLGILLLIGNNTVSGIGNVIIARDGKNIPPLVLSSATMIIGGSSLFLFSLPVEGLHPGPRPLEYYASLGWLSVLSASAISIWYVLLKRPGVLVSNLNFWKFLIPVAGAALAWMILPDEKPGWVALAGMVIIAVSLILLNINRRRQNRAGRLADRG